jgi:hypothetical protein
MIDRQIDSPIPMPCAGREVGQSLSPACDREPIPYALETDWLVEAAGFKHLHSRIGIAKTLSSRRQDSNLCILKSDLLISGIWPSLGTPELVEK